MDLQLLQVKSMRMYEQVLQSVVEKQKQALEALSALGSRLPAAVAAEQQAHINNIWQSMEELAVVANNFGCSAQAHETSAQVYETLAKALEDLRQNYSIQLGIEASAT